MTTDHTGAPTSPPPLSASLVFADKMAMLTQQVNSGASASASAMAIAPSLCSEAVQKRESCGGTHAPWERLQEERGQHAPWRAAAGGGCPAATPRSLRGTGFFARTPRPLHTSHRPHTLARTSTAHATLHACAPDSFPPVRAVPVPHRVTRTRSTGNRWRLPRARSSQRLHLPHSGGQGSAAAQPSSNCNESGLS